MKPETEHRIPALDGWRGLAILGVLVGHFLGRYGINLGRFGVELFFVLSGRLMADILFHRRVPLRVFFPRRFSRVYPALLCFIVVMAVLTRATHWFTIPWEVTLASLTFTVNYLAIFGMVSPATDHLWSLAIEEHCYLALGLLAFLSRRWPRIPVLGIIVAVIVAAALNGLWQTEDLGRHYHNVYWRTDVRVASILMGVAVMIWVQRQRARPAWTRWPVLPVLGLGFGLLLSLQAVPDPVKYTLGTLCLAWAVASIEFAPPPVRAVLESRGLTFIGIVSFSLYLWQQPFSLIPDMTLRLASLAAVAVLALLSYRMIEGPARLWLNRWLAPRVHPDRPVAVPSLVGKESVS